MPIHIGVLVNTTEEVAITTGFAKAAEEKTMRRKIGISDKTGLTFLILGFSSPQTVPHLLPNCSDLTLQSLDETHINNLVDIQLGDFRVGLAEKVLDHLDAGDGRRRHFLIDLRLTAPGFIQRFGIVYFMNRTKLRMPVS